MSADEADETEQDCCNQFLTVTQTEKSGAVLSNTNNNNNTDSRNLRLLGAK